MVSFHISDFLCDLHKRLFKRRGDGSWRQIQGCEGAFLYFFFFLKLNVVRVSRWPLTSALGGDPVRRQRWLPLEPGTSSHSLKSATAAAAAAPRRWLMLRRTFPAAVAFPHKPSGSDFLTRFPSRTLPRLPPYLQDLSLVRGDIIRSLAAVRWEVSWSPMRGQAQRFFGHDDWVKLKES